MLMLIDTRELPPEPDPPSPGWPGIVWRKLRWFTVVCLLLVASYASSGWISLGLVYAALLISVWRGLLLMPTVGGMRDYKQ